MSVTKEELERLYLEGFLQAYPSFPTSVPEPAKTPDFLLRLPDHVLGIELTRLFRKPGEGSSSLREQESLRERVSTRAKMIYDRTGLPPVHVSIHFNNRFHLRKGDVDSMAHCVADLAIRLMPEIEGRQEEQYMWTNRSYFPEEISLAMVYRPSSLSTSFWNTPSAGWLPQLSAREVQEEIDKKDKKIDSYWRFCDRAWLIVCSYGEGLSSMVDVSPEALTASYRARFERVFIFRSPSTVHQLAVSTSRMGGAKRNPSQ